MTVKTKKTTAWPDLNKTRVIVWTIGLKSALPRNWTRRLSADEEVRAARMRHPETRRAFILTRLALRSILGHYLSCVPAAVPLRQTLSGKPILVQTVGRPRLFFSVAHSFGLAMVAVSTAGHVGVDLEYTRRKVKNLCRLRQRMFPLSQMPWAKESGAEEFWPAWVVKEAGLKAAGVGIRGWRQLAVSDFAFDAARRHGEAFVCWRGRGHNSGTSWRVRIFRPRPFYLAAVAAPRAIRELLVVAPAVKTAG